MVKSLDDFKEFVHAAIERHRIDEKSLEGEVSLTLATALLASTRPDIPQVSPEWMLLRIREWYGPWLERMSVLAFMQHYKVPGSPQVRRLARALWENHQGSCQDPSECSLHSLGSLWAFRWLDSPDGEADWLVEALYRLIAEHPLRRWTLHLVSRAADWVEQGWMSATQAESLLTSALDAGLHEHLANTDSLASSWTILIDAVSPELRPQFARIGNRIIAAGGTCLIGAQLRLLRERPDKTWGP